MEIFAHNSNSPQKGRRKKNVFTAGSISSLKECHSLVLRKKKTFSSSAVSLASAQINCFDSVAESSGLVVCIVDVLLWYGVLVPAIKVNRKWCCDFNPPIKSTFECSTWMFLCRCLCVIFFSFFVYFYCVYVKHQLLNDMLLVNKLNI